MTVLAAFMVLLSSLHGTRPHSSRQSDREPRSDRDRGRDRPLHQHLGALRRSDGRAEFPHLPASRARNDDRLIRNQDLPFEKLVEAINPPRSHQVNPLFQVIVCLAEGDRDISYPPTADMSPGWGEGETTQNGRPKHREIRPDDVPRRGLGRTLWRHRICQPTCSIVRPSSASAVISATSLQAIVARCRTRRSAPCS